MGEKEEMKEMFQELTGFEKKNQDKWGTGQSYADRTGAYNV